MRFSPLHFLLLSGVLAAPVYDVSTAVKRNEENGLVARGLVPILPRSPIVAAPKPLAPKPPLKPPKRPDSSSDGGASPPPRLGASGDKTPDAEAPKDRPDPDDGSPGVASCSLGGRKRAICVSDDLNKDLTDAERQSFKAESQKLQSELDLAIKDNKLPNGKTIAPKTKEIQFQPDPNKQGTTTTFKTYEITSSKLDDAATLDKPYLKKWGEDFDKANAREVTLTNSQSQRDKADRWAQDELKPQLERDHKPNPDDPDDEFMVPILIQSTVDSVKSPEPMLRALVNAKGGAMVVKGTFKEKDYSHQGKVEHNGKTYQRPSFETNDADKLFPSDHMMAAWRKDVADTPGAKVSDLRLVAMDTVETATTRRLIKDTMTRHGQYKSGGQMTFDKDTAPSDFGDYKSSPHGAMLMRALRDEHEDLGNKQIKAFHVTMANDPAKPPDMVIELA